MARLSYKDYTINIITNTQTNIFVISLIALVNFIQILFFFICRKFTVSKIISGICQQFKV